MPGVVHDSVSSSKGLLLHVFSYNSICCFQCYFNFDTLKHTKTHNLRCLKLNICFMDGLEKSGLFMRRDMPSVKDRKTGRIDLSKLGHFCRRSDFFAAKLNYLTSLRNISHLLTGGIDDVQVKAIHLVRDPRATIRSRFEYRKRPLETFRFTSFSVSTQVVERAP